MTSGAAGARVAPRSAVERLVVRAAAVELPSAIPAFLEACAKLAGEASLLGDFERAGQLIELARRVASSTSA